MGFFLQLCCVNEGGDDTALIVIVLAIVLVPSDKHGLASGVLTSSIFIDQFAAPLISSDLIAILAYSHFYLLTAGFTALLAIASAAMLKAQTA